MLRNTDASHEPVLPSRLLMAGLSCFSDVGVLGHPIPTSNYMYNHGQARRWIDRMPGEAASVGPTRPSSGLTNFQPSSARTALARHPAGPCSRSMWPPDAAPPDALTPIRSPCTDCRQGSSNFAPVFPAPAPHALFSANTGGSFYGTRNGRAAGTRGVGHGRVFQSS